MDRKDLATMLECPLVSERGLQQARETLRITHPESPYLERNRQEVASLEQRWAAEAPARALRARATRAGFRRSDRKPGVWIRRNVLQRWQEYSAEQVIDELTGDEPGKE